MNIGSRVCKILNCHLSQDKVRSQTRRLTRSGGTFFAVQVTLFCMTSLFSRLSVGYIGVNEEERRKVGASPTSVKLSPESGGGYLSYLESHHHIHCLVS